MPSHCPAGAPARRGQGAQEPRSGKPSQEDHADGGHDLVGRQHDALRCDQVVEGLAGRIGAHAALLQRGAQAAVAVAQADQLGVVAVVWSLQAVVTIEVANAPESVRRKLIRPAADSTSFGSTLPSAMPVEE